MSEFDILAVGDVAPHRTDPATMFAHVAEVLSAAPIVFGQQECCLTDRGTPPPHVKLAMRSPPSTIEAIRQAGFTMMSFAGNHAMDWGVEGFRDTIHHVREAGILLAGAGETLTEAWAPVIQDHAGTKVALLAASSILPEGYSARTDKPGCAPMWAHTYYEQIEHDQPGTPARVRTHPDRADLARLKGAVKAARAQADIVLLSLHWGIHMVRGSLAEYQVEVARAAIDAGADAILGHHPHVMKGIDFYRGKPIFYSLGNFAIEQPHAFDPSIVESDSFRHLVSLNPHWALGESYMLPEETRVTGIARLAVKDKAITAVRFRPCYAGEDSAPRPLEADEPLFARVRDYLVEVSESEGLSTHIAVDSDELIFTPG